MRQFIVTQSLSFSLIVTTLAQGVGLMAPSHYLKANTTQKTFPEARYIKTWNEVAANWGKVKSGADVDRAAKKLNLSFNKAFEDTDRKFWISYMIQVQDLAFLKQDGDSYEFWSPGFKEKLLSFKTDNDKYLFEKGVFVYKATESLETNLQRLKKVVDVTEVSFLDRFFLPRAEADSSVWWAVGGAFATFLIVRTVQTRGDNFRAAGVKRAQAHDQLHQGNLGSSAVRATDAVFTPFLYNENNTPPPAGSEIPPPPSP